jgi:hypothetical protein
MKLPLLFLLATLSFTAQAVEPETPESREQAAQRLRANAELDANILRVRLLTQPANDRKAAGNAENRRRCEAALRVATQCGRSTGLFSCDETGFHPTPSGDLNAPSRSRDSERSKTVERCEVQARKESAGK